MERIEGHAEISVLHVPYGRVLDVNEFLTEPIVLCANGIALPVSEKFFKFENFVEVVLKPRTCFKVLLPAACFFIAAALYMNDAFSVFIGCCAFGAINYLKRISGINFVARFGRDKLVKPILSDSESLNDAEIFKRKIELAYREWRNNIPVH